MVIQADLITSLLEKLHELYFIYLNNILKDPNKNNWNHSGVDLFGWAFLRKAGSFSSTLQKGGGVAQ